MPAGAKITVELPNGRKEIYVKATKEQILRRDYSSLMGKPICVSDAVNKYHIPRSTVIDWIANQYITVLKPGYGMEINEAELAYCADVYKQRKEANTTRGGAPLLDSDGLPNSLKHPKLSAYRLRRKQVA